MLWSCSAEFVLHLKRTEATSLTLDTNPLSSRHNGRAPNQDACIEYGVDAA